MLYPTKNMEQGRLVGEPSRGTLILQSWVAAKIKKIIINIFSLELSSHE